MGVEVGVAVGVNVNVGDGVTVAVVVIVGVVVKVGKAVGVVVSVDFEGTTVNVADTIAALDVTEFELEHPATKTVARTITEIFAVKKRNLRSLTSQRDLF